MYGIVPSKPVQPYYYYYYYICDAWQLKQLIRFVIAYLAHWVCGNIFVCHFLALKASTLDLIRRCCRLRWPIPGILNPLTITSFLLSVPLAQLLAAAADT